MNNTYQRKSNRQQEFHSPFENILNEMMNIPLKKIVNPDEVNTIYPSANIEEHEDKYTIHLMVPGMSKKDISIQLDKSKLIIKNKEVTADDSSNVKYKLREFNYKSFERTFKLPSNLLTSEIKASLSKGILTISLQKDPDSTRTISVG